MKTISRTTENVIRAILAAHERYTDQRSYPVHVVLYDDGRAEAMTFQAWQCATHGVSVYRFNTRPDFGEDDWTPTLAEYIEMFGTDDVEYGIEQARLEDFAA